MRLCDYGCEQEAKYQFKNGKWCCSSNVSSCPVFKEKKKGSWVSRYGKEKAEDMRKNLSKVMKINNPMFFKDPWNKGKHGIYSESTIKQIRKGGLKNKGKTWEEIHGKEKTKILKEKQSIRMTKYNKKSKPWNKGIKNCFSKEVVLKIQTKRKQTNLKKYKVENYQQSEEYKKQWLKKHPFLCKIEEIKVENNNYYVHCKNHNCPNSKEKGGWFIPTIYQLGERAGALEHMDGNDGAYFYCSDKCKEECPLYYLQSDPFKNKEKPYTNSEYQTFRQFVLERDKYICQYCGEKATEVHHIRPQKLEPFFALDPNYAISVCRDCHYKYGHKDECSTGELAKKICKEY